MYHSIKIRLSEAAQKAAVLTGIPGPREISFVLEPADLPRAVELGASIKSDGSVSLDATEAPSPYDSKRRWPVASCGRAVIELPRTPTSACEALSLVGEARAALVLHICDVANGDAKEWLAAPLRSDGSVVDVPPLLSEATSDLREEVETTSGREITLRAAEKATREAAELAAGIAAIGDVERYVRALPTEARGPDLRAPFFGMRVPAELAERINEAARIERERRKAAPPRRLAALLIELDLADERLREHATAEHPLGLWSEGEARAAIRERILPREVGRIKARESWVAADVPHGEDCENSEDCSVSFVAPIAETLSKAEYHSAHTSIELLRAGLPLVAEGNALRTGEVWRTIYRHIGSRSCLIDDDSISVLEVTVTVDLGDGVVIEREYLL